MAIPEATIELHPILCGQCDKPVVYWIGAAEVGMPLSVRRVLKLDGTHPKVGEFKPTCPHCEARLMGAPNVTSSGLVWHSLQIEKGDR